ncbi:hypothetical protein NBG4_40037 [Candidatus Sulfobium mesophilum]|uniref:Uncharacterized protein n=1 Tax=Candidatus Sulfobium mesophilum TaxID=2016548 RepID=A0A2U3QHU9_9BACT|nr:hypothetical protein NBG4_40037 [Candidatus Sulfobium mesophilum]
MRGSIDEESIRIKTTGMIKDPRSPIRYRYSRNRNIITMHHEKNDDASWRFAIGICPEITYRAIILDEWKRKPITARLSKIIEVVLVPLKNSMTHTIAAAK